MSSLNLHFGYTITKYIIYETGRHLFALVTFTWSGVWLIYWARCPSRRRWARLVFTRHWELILLLWGLPRWQRAGPVDVSLITDSPWWQCWRRADTAATATFATTGVEPVLPLWASLSASAGSWYHRRGVHYPVAVLVQWSCHHGGRHVRVTPAVVVSPHTRWADHVVVGFAT